MAATPSGESDAAAQPCPLRIYTVDDLGLLKVVEATSLEQLEAAQVVHKWGEPDRAQCIDRLCTAVGAATQTSNMLDAGLDLLGVGRANGRVELFEFARGGLRGGVAPTACARGEEEDVRIRGLAFLQHAVGPANRQPSVLSCTLAGTVRIHGAVSSDEATQQEWHEQATWAVPRDVDALAVDGSSARLAVGCQGTELTVWDIATRQRLYLAKGNKPNRIGLVDKPWNAAVAFLPGPDSNKIMTGTGHHKLRLYDMRQRRPALDIAFAESRVTALAPEADGARCWASNGKGQVEVLDLAAAKMGGALQGVGGAGPASKGEKMAGKILIVCTQFTDLPKGRGKTGCWAEEAVTPYYVYQSAGYDADFASPNGGKIPWDPRSLEDNFKTQNVARFLSSNDNQKAEHSMKLSDVKADDYDAIWLAGGHGVMWDFYPNETLAKLVSTMWDAGKAVGSVCHGPAGLLGAKTGGKFLVNGKRMTGFSNKEEREFAKLDDVVPFLLEDKLKEEGGKYESSDIMAVFSVMDGRLVTGQNPVSSEATAKMLVSVIRREP
ncbi:hypothetical protein WJX72_005540 [[Myrmecia] bisecta]|uniref:DJ-1/PfpI domain-containing protein n=1 Tax=[Myrmecia] bisecta TaxID=41462 RepID=A0AAW1R7A5_9CHLO